MLQLAAFFSNNLTPFVGNIYFAGDGRNYTAVHIYAAGLKYTLVLVRPIIVRKNVFLKNAMYFVMLNSNLLSVCGSRFYILSPKYFFPCILEVRKKYLLAFKRKMRKWCHGYNDDF